MAIFYKFSIKSLCCEAVFLAGLSVFCTSSASAAEGTGFFDVVKLDLSRNRDSDTIRMETKQLFVSKTLKNDLILESGYTTFKMDAQEHSGLRAGNTRTGRLDYYLPWIGLKTPVWGAVQAEVSAGYESTSLKGAEMKWSAALPVYLYPVSPSWTDSGVLLR